MRQIAVTALAVGASACMAGHEMDVRLPAGSCASTEAADVAWARPVSDGEQSRLDDWCEATGEPVVRMVSAPPSEPGFESQASLGGGPAAAEPQFATDASPAGRVDSLVVATWNVEVGSGDLVRFLDEQIGHACDAATATRTRRSVPFVLLVQEAHRASDEIPAIPNGLSLPGSIGKSDPHPDRADIVEIADRCGLSLFYAPSMRNGVEAAGEVPEDRGNAILASVPLTDFAAIELPLETQRRVAVTAIAHPPGRESVRVVSFHLDVASDLLRVLKSGNSTRLRQGLGLARALDELRAGEAARTAVIGGDVNSWSEKETAIRHLVERFPESPRPTSEGTRGSYPTDHVFVRAAAGSQVRVEHASYRVAPDAYGSDHRARLLTLRFAGAKTLATAGAGE